MSNISKKDALLGALLIQPDPKADDYLAIKAKIAKLKVPGTSDQGFVDAPNINLPVDLDADLKAQVKAHIEANPENVLNFVEKIMGGTVAEGDFATLQVMMDVMDVKGPGGEDIIIDNISGPQTDYAITEFSYKLDDLVLANARVDYERQQPPAGPHADGDTADAQSAWPPQSQADLADANAGNGDFSTVISRTPQPADNIINSADAGFTAPVVGPPMDGDDANRGFHHKTHPVDANSGFGAFADGEWGQSHVGEFGAAAEQTDTIAGGNHPAPDVTPNP